MPITKKELEAKVIRLEKECEKMKGHHRRSYSRSPTPVKKMPSEHEEYKKRPLTEMNKFLSKELPKLNKKLPPREAFSEAVKLWNKQKK